MKNKSLNNYLITNQGEIKMAKSGFKLSGRMSVGKFEDTFYDEFGVRCDVLKNGEFADNSASLASLRPDDFQGSGSVDFTLKANMKVKNVLKKFEEAFGLQVQVYKSEIATGDETLASLRAVVVPMISDDVKTDEIQSNDNSTNNIAFNNATDKISQLVESGIPGKVLSFDDFINYLKDLSGEVTFKTHQLFNTVFANVEDYLDMGGDADLEYMGGSSTVYIIEQDIMDWDESSIFSIAFVDELVVILHTGEDSDLFIEWLSKYYLSVCPDATKGKLNWDTFSDLYQGDDKLLFVNNILTGLRNFASGDEEMEDSFDFLTEDGMNSLRAEQRFILSSDAGGESHDMGLYYITQDKNLTLSSSGVVYETYLGEDVEFDNNIASTLETDLFDSFWDEVVEGAMVVLVEKT